MRRRRIVIAAVTAVATLAVVGYGAASAVVYDTLTKVSGDCPPAWESNDPTSFELLAFEGGPVEGHADFDTTPYRMPEPETVTIPSRDAGIEISGWYLPAESPEAPAVVLVHGVTACKRDHAILLPAGMLHRNGFSVLMVDLRDHGDSTFEDGRYAGGTEEYRDVLGAWDWLQANRGVPADRIGLVGVSLGAATVLIATGNEPRVAATWEDSSYADLPSIIRDELTRASYPTFLETGAVLAAKVLGGDDLTSFSPLDGVNRLDGRPIFITHGDLDDRIAVRYGHALVAAAEAAGSNPATWFVPGSGHTQAMVDQPAEYERRLVNFFAATLGPAAGSPSPVPSPPATAELFSAAACYAFDELTAAVGNDAGAMGPDAAALRDAIEAGDAPAIVAAIPAVRVHVLEMSRVGRLMESGWAPGIAFAGVFVELADLLLTDLETLEAAVKGGGMPTQPYISQEAAFALYQELVVEGRALNDNRPGELEECA